MSLILAMLLSQTAVQVTNNKANTTAIAARCVNAAGTAFESCGGAGGAAPSYVNVLVDGGWMTVTVLNPTPAYVNALLDGGWTTVTVLNPVGYVNALIDGGWSTVTVLNPTPTYQNVLIDGGWSTVTVLNPVAYVNATIDGGVINVIPRKTAAAALASAFSCTSAAAVAPTTALTNRTSLCITNLSPHTTVYVGHAAVTASTGTALAPAPTQSDGGIGVGGTYCDDVGAQPLSCITSTGTADVRLLEQ